MPGKEIAEIIALPRVFLDSLGIGISIVDSSTGHILFANAECCRILGYPLEQLRTGELTFIDLTHPEDREGNRLQHDKLVTGEVASYQLDKRYLRQDGSVVWGRVIVNPIRDASGRMKWFCAVVEDITATKILEQQLAAAEKLAGLSTFNLIVDTDDSKGEFPSAPSSSVRDMLCRVHPEDRNGLEQAIGRAIMKRTGYTRDYRVLTKDGAMRWVRGMATSVYSPSDGRTRLVGATIDVTTDHLGGENHMPESIRNILDHIETHWDQKISIEQLAARYGVSPRTVYQYFAKNGMSLAEKIKLTRMQHARRMLYDAKAGDTVTSIALRCCFSNPGHFAREYRKIYGETPSESLRQASLRPASHDDPTIAPSIR
ncbi:helix-turn-helix transcriptional regulator [Bradyrhizobium sp. SZCCHNR1002]|uniref:helix-turn-helix transcriptional regulator n=1 Tax=Bradyrhizobium sp. SZCCHNR1002 TaxID=3057334 RepID=UPI0028EF5794|nr:PAS domain-containing protein [Bradyrhizobium sp. SZCCHNR1002]